MNNFNKFAFSAAFILTLSCPLLAMDLEKIDMPKATSKFSLRQEDHTPVKEVPEQDYSLNGKDLKM